MQTRICTYMYRKGQKKKQTTTFIGSYLDSSIFTITDSGTAQNPTFWIIGRNRTIPLHGCQNTASLASSPHSHFPRAAPNSCKKPTMPSKRSKLGFERNTRGAQRSILRRLPRPHVRLVRHELTLTRADDASELAFWASTEKGPSFAPTADCPTRVTFPNDGASKNLKHFWIECQV